jgi:hypothetical protein
MLHKLQYKHIVIQCQIKMRSMCPPFCSVGSAAGASLSRLTVCIRRTVESGNRGGVRALSQNFIDRSINEWQRRLECVVQQNGGHIEHFFN